VSDLLVTWAKQNLLMAFLAVCVGAGGAAALANYVYIAPANRDIAALQQQNADLRQKLEAAQAERSPAPPPDDPSALPETGVPSGTSVTTSDGRLNIMVHSVIGRSVRLSTRIDSEKAVEHDLLSIGDRVTVEASDKVYYIDLRRARSDMLDMSVSQRRK